MKFLACNKYLAVSQFFLPEEKFHNTLKNMICCLYNVKDQRQD